jgi:uncharacterized protein YdaU (DUF1376 family)
MTDPFLTTDTDIRGMHSFLMNAPKLLGSITWQIASGDEAKAAVTLWARAWLEAPAGSLPNDHKILAALAGVSMAKWKKLQGVALRGFVLCSDGRLYHKMLCEDAKRAYQAKQDNSNRTKGATEARKRQRDEKRNGQRDVDVETNATTTHREGDGESQGEKIQPTPPPSPGVLPRAESATTSATATNNHLARRVEAISPAHVNRALLCGDLWDLLEAFKCQQSEELRCEWERETDQAQMGTIATILLWRSRQLDPIRMPSGFGKARREYRGLATNEMAELVLAFQEFIEEKVNA